MIEVKRPIRFFGKSLERFGEKFKKILDLGLNDGLEFFTVRGNKMFILINKYSEEKSLVIHYDLVNDKITLQKEFNKLIHVDYLCWFDVSDSLDFMDEVGNFYKYDINTNDYIVKYSDGTLIDTFAFIENKFFVGKRDNTYVLDKDGNIIKTFPFGSYYFTYDKTTNEVYAILEGEDRFYIINLNTLEYREVAPTLPNGITLSLPYGNCVRRIPNTNYILFACENSKKIYKINLDTLEVSEFLDISFFDYIDLVYISEDCKRIYFCATKVEWHYRYETYVYDVENNEIDVLYSSNFAWYILENTKTNKIIFGDAQMNAPTYILDLKTRRVEAVVCTHWLACNRTDGNLIFML
jgi:hypothetical protein